MNLIGMLLVGRVHTAASTKHLVRNLLRVKHMRTDALGRACHNDYAS